MASVPTQSFTVWVQQFASGVQGRASALIDFAVGAVLRSFGEALAGVSLWLQGQSLDVLKESRLSTAEGVNVDSFTADFMPLVSGTTSPRLPASPASGVITYSRYSTSTSAPFIPNGSICQTADGTQQFTVIANTTLPGYSGVLGGYTMPAGQTSVDVQVQGITANPLTGQPGTNGNVLAGAITVNLSSITGVDFIANAAALTNGVDAELDPALKARFALFIAGLAKGNLAGIETAVAGLTAATTYSVVDQQTVGGSAQPGYFYVVVDDGSGSPPAAFLSAAQTAINANRALGVNFTVIAPTLVTANVNAILTTLSGYSHNAVVAAAQALVSGNITALGLGTGLDVYQIAAWLLSVPGVAPGGVAALTLNGLSGDAGALAASPKNRVMPGSVTIS